MIRLIAAIDCHRGLARHGILPWSIPEDEQYFTDQTKQHGGDVLTGAKTFKQTYHGPLTDRHNFILTHDATPIPGVTLVHDLDKFLQEFHDKDLWVAGGATVFAATIKSADELYLTHIDADFGCDQFFPEYEQQFKPVGRSEPHEQNGFHFSYARYAKSR
jgi:dihydrofolate reductase